MSVLACPVCDYTAVSRLDAPLKMPVLMNKIYSTAAEGKAAVMGPLEFVACPRCGFTWNAAFDPSLIVYDEEYENDQTYSPSFRRHMQQRAQDVVDSVSVDESVVYLEVGCGQGRFIEEVVAVAGGRLGSAEGFDPAWRGEEGTGPSGSRIHRCYFDKDTASRLEKRPNVVVSRHTIEHVPDPISFLSSIREALGSGSTARMWVETPCVEWILKNRAMQDFFYEHCSLFTAGSLAFALERSGFRSPRISRVFGGQYLWAEAVACQSVEVSEPQTAGYEPLDTVRKEFLERWRAEIAAAADQGRVALWGAGAKGVSFALLSDPEQRMIDHVVDVNPVKQRKYLPGSGLLVLSPEEAAKRIAKTVFVMNPNYLDEISATAREVGINARLVPID
ncbi:MAG TPA: methyltransferase [Rhodobiaceae bacterium]|nr:methyltransferase [Rhodobiaceae bacterium]